MGAASSPSPSLLPDTYTVTETLKDGWENTTPLTQTAVGRCG